MREYLFPVEYKAYNHWDTQMIQEWQASRKPYLSFAFNRFSLHSLPQEPFWLYLYYTKSRSEEAAFRGKLRYRFQVIQWAREQYGREDTYCFPSALDPRVWFLCDQFQEVRRASGESLAYEDFQHAEGKNLASSLRSSIVPVVCKAQIRVARCYP